MLSIEEYRAKVLSLTRLLEPEPCPLGYGWGRILASDLVAEAAVPPFTNSAMDGFAVRGDDLQSGVQTLVVVGDIPAGCSDLPTVGVGQAARIMTGAPLPLGADTVVPVEMTDQPSGDAPLSETVTVQPVPPGKNVRHAGENLQIGAVVLREGSPWSATAAAAAASTGYSQVPLRRRPRIAVISTGTELAEPGAPLGTGQLPDSNGILLEGLVAQFGAELALRRRVPDDQEAFHRCLQDCARAKVDLIVSSGAVSVGAHEVVRQTLEKQIDFVSVAMQPGKPQACGRFEMNGSSMAFLGLPGNPVSVFVSAWVFLRPLIRAFQGANPTMAPPVRMKTLRGWTSPSGRRGLAPVKVTSHGVEPAHGLGTASHLVASLPDADGFAVVPEDLTRVEPGDMVDVYLIQ